MTSRTDPIIVAETAEEATETFLTTAESGAWGPEAVAWARRVRAGEEGWRPDPHEVLPGFDLGYGLPDRLDS